MSIFGPDDPVAALLAAAHHNPHLEPAALAAARARLAEEACEVCRRRPRLFDVPFGEALSMITNEDDFRRWDTVRAGLETRLVKPDSVRATFAALPDGSTFYHATVCDFTPDAAWWLRQAR